jgi:hypothetical protein
MLAHIEATAAEALMGLGRADEATQRALRALLTVGANSRGAYDLLLTLGRAELAAGRTEAAGKTLMQALDSAQRGGRPDDPTLMDALAQWCEQSQDAVAALRWRDRSAASRTGGGSAEQLGWRLKALQAGVELQTVRLRYGRVAAERARLSAQLEHSRRLLSAEAPMGTPTPSLLDDPLHASHPGFDPHFDGEAAGYGLRYQPVVDLADGRVLGFRGAAAPVDQARRQGGAARIHPPAREQPLHQVAHAADLLRRRAARPRRGRTGPSSHRRAGAAASSPRSAAASLSMQNWPQPGRPSRRPHWARQSKALRAARLGVHHGLQPRLDLQVVAAARASHGARRQAGHAGELDHVLVARAGQHRLKLSGGVAFLGDGERRAQLHAAAPSACTRAMSSKLRMPPAAISGTSRSTPAPRRKASACGMHVLEVEARVVQVGDLRGAQVAAGQARVLDDDGVGQALLALPLLHHQLHAARVGQDRHQQGLRVVGARSGRSSGRPAPTTTASMPASSARAPRRRSR